MYNTFEEVAERYAKALFASASEDNKLKKIDDSINAFSTMLEASEDFRKAMRMPGIKPDEYQASFDEIAKRMKLDPLMKNFIKLLCSRKRVFLFPAIIRHFQALMSLQRGEIQATVISAQKMSTPQLKKLTETLQPFSNGGKVLVNHRVDENLIGGFKVLMGARMIDLTVKSRLEAIHTTLSEA